MSQWKHPPQFVFLFMRALPPSSGKTVELFQFSTDKVTIHDYNEFK